MFFYVQSTFVEFCCACYGSSKEGRKTKFLIEQNWDHKKRDNKKLCCFVAKDDQEYPYFWSQEDSHDFTKISENGLVEFYKETLKGTYNITSLIKEEQQTLWYVLENIKKGKNLRIEGLDKDFAQEMFQRISKLPAKIKEEIAAISTPTMLVNTHYAPSQLDVIWDDENNKERCACGTAASAACGVSAAQCYFWSLLNQAVTIPVNLVAYSTTIIFSGSYIYSYLRAKHWLKETPEQKDQRQGFTAISLLQEMKCQIVDAKEKTD